MTVRGEPNSVSSFKGFTNFKSGWRRLVEFYETIKFSHSIFALPFAILALFIVYDGLPQLSVLWWIILAMVTIRTFGMAANRLVDAALDKANPRTANRALPAGRITSREVVVYMVVSLALYGLAVAFLDPITWLLATIPVLVMLGYPFAKRFTWLAHFGVGAVYLIVPPAVELAITGGPPSAGLVLLGVGGMLWVTGFDILYATTDYDSDIELGVHSIPAQFGVAAALWWARCLHLATVLVLLAAGIVIGAGWLYYTGVGVVFVLLAYENSLVRATNLTKLNTAFFTMNGVIAVIFSLSVCIDVLIS